MGKRHAPEEIVAKLRQVDVLTAQGRAIAEAIQAIGVTEVTYYRWRSEYGGLDLKAFSVPGDLRDFPWTEKAVRSTTGSGQKHPLLP